MCFPGDPFPRNLQIPLISDTLLRNPNGVHSTVEIVNNETGFNEQPDTTSRFVAEVRSRGVQ